MMYFDDFKDNEFAHNFQEERKFSTEKKILESFEKSSVCLNKATKNNIQTSHLQKVCLILMNDHDSKGRKLGVGPLNDGYLIFQRHQRLGYKVFYLYNPSVYVYSTFLKFFIKNTTEKLTVFYSGPDDKIVDGIEFDDGTFSMGEINDVIANNCNGKTQITFITDSLCGNSVFDISGGKNMISLFAKKNDSKDFKEIEKSHGIFTYYLCKITNDCGNITTNELIEKMSHSLIKFNVKFTCAMSDKKLGYTQIF